MESVSEHLKKARETLHAFEHGGAPSATPAIKALIDAVQAVDTTALVADSIQKLELKPGDVVFVKLGDPATGWIPGQESVDRLKSLFELALDQAGVNNKVSVVLWNYAANVEVVHETPKEV